MGLSSFASKPVEEVVAANPQTLFQLYWAGSRELISQRVRRAKAAGAVGLIVTLDWSFSHGRDWGSPALPDQLDFKTMVKLAPEALSRPQWFYRWARTERPPGLTVPNMGAPGEPAPRFFGVYGEWMQTPLPTWEDLRWLRDQWDGPIVLKGVLHPDDARRAADAGMDGVVVSNHGGRQIDGEIASLDALPDVVAAVGDRMAVLFDSGIRTGSDVIKALALGADAVLVGRPYVYGLGLGGEDGVRHVLRSLLADLDLTVGLSGCRTLHELTRELLVPS